MVTKEVFCAELDDVKCDANRDFYSMQYSLVINILIVFIGAVCFFLSAIYIIKDKERVERYVAGTQKIM